MTPKRQSKNDGPLVVHGYTVIQVKASDRRQNIHCLYVKEHSSPDTKTEWPCDRTLMVHNVPSYCKQENIRFLFRNCGTIVRVHLQSKVSSGPLESSPFMPDLSTSGSKIAYIVFRKHGGIKNAGCIPYNQVQLLSDSGTPIVSGLRAYIKDYEASIVDVPNMEKAAEDYMAEYYKTKLEAEQREKQMEGVPDDDGFIKVTRHGKNKGGKRTEETEKKGHNHIRTREKKNELKDFYTFQFRETKRKHIADLQAKFEEDKQKVQQMKIARKFKPY